jgi:3',5'-cyclic AMP phosphodiesterase CpdA
MNRLCLRFTAVVFAVLVGLNAGAVKDFRFSGDGKFKIMQVTDTHIKAASNPELSIESVNMLNQVLDAEKPDLVIFTGDVITEKPYRKGLDFILEPVIRRKIPWIVLFGNHDEEQDLSRKEMSELIETYPYHAGRMKKLRNVTGYGNFVIEVKGQVGRQIQALIYCMDSRAYSDRKPVIDGYAWFAHDQVVWYRKTSERYTAGNNNQPLPALAFFHIPLPEYNEVTQKDRHVVGDKLENNCPPDVNSGMFLSMVEKGDVMGTFVGHDHVNDYIFNYCGIALAYGRFSGSKTTYNSPKDGEAIQNGARIIELTEGQHSFHTWIRLDADKVIHDVHFPEDFPTPVKK